MKSSHSRESEQNKWTSPFEKLLRQATQVSPSTTTGRPIQRPRPIFGTPREDIRHWDGQQSYSDTCAIRCQEFIIEQFTGYEIEEGLLVQVAIEQGWYTPGVGTKPEDVGKLLELYGIPVNRYQQASVFHLALELAQGHKVIVAVDSRELWTNNNEIFDRLDKVWGLRSADHAVVVSGIDMTDPDNVRVIISDPGTGEAVASYPIEQFVNAWRGSNFFLVATQDPAPPHVPGMKHFDYRIGHIPRIAGVAYEQFLMFANQPQTWEYVLHCYLEGDGSGYTNCNSDENVAFKDGVTISDNITNSTAVLSSLSYADDISANENYFDTHDSGDSDRDIDSSDDIVD